MIKNFNDTQRYRAILIYSLGAKSNFVSFQHLNRIRLSPMGLIRGEGAFCKNEV